MIILILKMSNTSFGCQNLDKKNSLLVVDVMVSFFWNQGH